MAEVPARSGSSALVTAARSIGVFLLLLLVAARALAAGVTLAWDPVTSPLLAGYMVYYGPAAGNYPTKIDVGNVTTFPVPNLVEGATYHFVATAYDGSHAESGFSNDITATVPYSTPVAQFTASATSGVAPLALNFLNASTGTITSHAWTFGDGGTSTVASPSHVYLAAGVYTVRLTVTGPGGSNTRTRSNYVTVSAAQPDTGLYRKVVRSTGAPFYKFLLDFNFDHAPDATIPFGIAGDRPLVGKVATGGKTSLIIYRNGVWYIDSNRNGTVDTVVGFGGVNVDIPLTANFAGPGATDNLVVYRSGVWLVDQNFDGIPDKTYTLGGAFGDVPVAGDINGDGVADLAIYRMGTWFFDTNRNGAADLVVGFGGLAQDIPMLFDWNGDGKADLCIFRDGMWYVSTKRDGVADVVFGYGGPGDLPFVGTFH
jgi:PKD repeat protein